MLLLILFVICIVVLVVAWLVHTATWCGYLYRFDQLGQHPSEQYTSGQPLSEQCIARAYTSKEWVNALFTPPPQGDSQDNWQRLKTDLVLRCGDFAYDRKARYKCHGCFIFSPAPLHWDELLEIGGLLPTS